MAHWTNTEQRRLVEAHQSGYPSVAELGDMFPRHRKESVKSRAYDLDLRHRGLKWLKIAHVHFAKREAEIREWAAQSIFRNAG